MKKRYITLNKLNVGMYIFNLYKTQPCYCVVCYSYSLTYSLFHLSGFVHPLQDVVLHQCLLLFSVCYFPVPGGSLLPYHLLLGCPSSFFMVVTLCSVCPPIVLHSCYVFGPSPLLFQCVFCNVDYLCSFPDL